MSVEASSKVPDLGIRIENVVATASFDQRFDLIEIMEKFRDVKYQPKQFPGLIFRLEDPKTAILIFSTGKMVCTGAKSEEMARSAVHKVVRQLQEGGIVIHSEPKIEIQNMVASANLHKWVDLEATSDMLDEVMYEPEQFAGLIYRMKSPKTVLLIFASGKIVCTGAKSEEMVYESVSKLHELLEDYGLFLD